MKGRVLTIVGPSVSVSGEDGRVYMAPLVVDAQGILRVDASAIPPLAVEPPPAVREEGDEHV